MIGIAVINYKTYSKTIDCITSIRKTTKEPYKIYLLENGSNDESADILCKEYSDSDDVDIILSTHNHGYARGNNICIQHMRQDGCSYGLISNNDIICEKDSIDRLADDIKNHPDYLLVGPAICDPEGQIQRSVKLHQYSPAEYLLKSTYLSHFSKKTLSRDRSEMLSVNKFREVQWVSGAFFIFDLHKFYEIGDFDPKTFLFFEEYILSAKAQKKGYKLGYEPDAKVLHYHAASTGGGINIQSKIEADRSERYYFKSYTNRSGLFLAVLKQIRILEVFFTFGKKRDLHSIKKYLEQVKRPL